jgi:AcrR family transcriptional regulator
MAEGNRTKRLDEDRERAILRATYDLVAECGYQGLRVDAVAARAQASKATLYRHWPTKAGLVIDAVKFCRAATEDLPDTGTLRGDLVAWFSDMATQMSGDQGPILAGLFAALQSEPELAAELRSMRDSKVAHAEVVCARALKRGELSPGYNADVVDEVVPALMFMRAFGMGDPLDAAFVDHLVDDIILPLLGNCA